jgi:hypothetical protein
MGRFRNMSPRASISSLAICLLLALTTTVFSQPYTRVLSRASRNIDLSSYARARQELAAEALLGSLEQLGVENPPPVDYFLEKFREEKALFRQFEDFRVAGGHYELVEDSLLGEKKYYNQLNQLVLEMSLSVSVYRHGSGPDPAFTFNVAGIDDVYRQGEFLRFVFTPQRNGYLNIIWVSPAGAHLLYPFTGCVLDSHNDDAGYLFEGRRSAFFPLARAFGEGYSLDQEEPAEEGAPVLLLFVYTRNLLVLDAGDSLEGWMRAIFAVPMPEKSLQQHGFRIYPAD